MSRGVFSGRQRGSPNRRTQAQVEAVLATGISPLDYLLAVMRDETRLTKTRMDAARAAAPYVHPRLSAIQIDLDTLPRTAEEMSDAELWAIACREMTTEELDDRIGELMAKLEDGPPPIAQTDDLAPP